jgi:hypothetical protein
MIKPKKYIDIIFILLLALLSCYSIYGHFSTGYTLSIYNYLGFSLLLIFTLLKFSKPDRELYGMFILLFLSTFNIINFNVVVVKFNNLPFNIFAFFALVVYSAINKDMVTQIVKKGLKGSEKEQEDRRNKMISFYYDKFNKCDEEEFEQIFRNIEEYPMEAQSALKQLSTGKDKM